MGSDKFEILSAAESHIQRWSRKNKEESDRDKDSFSPEMYDGLPKNSPFEIDRDRILYSKAFRRLKGKTQVFLASEADHLRTRLTHTLEVSQISRMVAKGLGLDEALTEAIALGHDFGHTPFGHVGERTLNQIMNGCDSLDGLSPIMSLADKGFKHNWQGIRVACDLESIYNEPGLQLTNFTLWGILNHTKTYWNTCKSLIGNNPLCYSFGNSKDCSAEPIGQSALAFYDNVYKSSTKIKDYEGEAWSFEGMIVKNCDEIAQRHHDIEDALNRGIIDKEDLFEIISNNFKSFFSGNSQEEKILSDLFTIMRKDEGFEISSYLSKFIIILYTTNLLENSRGNLNKFITEKNILTRNDFEKNYPDYIVNDLDTVCFTSEFLKKDKEFHDYLRDRILNSYTAQQMDGKGRYIIRKLFKAYTTNPRQSSDSAIVMIYSTYLDSLPENIESLSIQNRLLLVDLINDLQKDRKGMTPLKVESDVEDMRSAISILIDQINDEKVKNSEKKIIGILRDHVDSAVSKNDYQFQIALFRATCDFIAGMTDDFAIDQYQILYG